MIFCVTENVDHGGGGGERMRGNPRVFRLGYTLCEDRKRLLFTTNLSKMHMFY